MNKPFQKDNTMNFIIGDHLYAVSTDGCDCIVHTEKGDFRHNKTWNREPEKDELPTVFFSALAGTYEGETFPDYEAWLDYICEEDSEEAKKIVKRIAKLTLAMLYRLCNGILLAT